MVAFIEFLTQQWMLSSVLSALLILLFLHESRKGAKGVTPQQLTNYVNKEEGLVVDLRDATEFKAGHIVDAIHIPHTDAVKRVAELEKHKNRPLILVCKMGQHAGPVSKQLKALGFENIYKLTGGIAEWQTSQMPLVKS